MQPLPPTKRCTKPVHAAYNPNAPRTGPGVYCLDDIRARCRVDEETGCWHWSMAMRSGGHMGTSTTPSVSMPYGVIGDQRRTLTVPRVVWLMAGKPLRASHVVWRTCGCHDCCAPGHLMAGTKRDEGAFWRKVGTRRNNPMRAVINARNVAPQAVPLEKVRAAMDQLAAGKLQREVAAAIGVHKATISRIATGQHFHQRAKGARGSSVFNLGMAAV